VIVKSAKSALGLIADRPRKSARNEFDLPPVRIAWLTLTRRFESGDAELKRLSCLLLGRFELPVKN
jgi:hypothetical protein